MPPFLLDLELTSGWFPLVVYGLAALAVVLLVAVPPGPRWRTPPRRRMRWVGVALAAAAAGAGVGALVAWVLSDLLDLFHADLALDQRGWAVGTAAAIGVAVASFVGCRWRRAIAAVLSIALFLLAGTVGINASFGEYPTIRSIYGLSPFQDALPVLANPAHRPTLAEWTAPADLPPAGVVAAVDIPPTASGFTTRDALVYLPPAALTADPPLLPVLIAMSGQPGNPQDVLTVAQMRQSLDAYAAAHQGLAPIVVSPDQLGGDPQQNPMCVDSPLGNSATYLTVDVPAWITAHLPVLASPQDWGVSGFSQGGTCAIQLGAAHPELFGVILDVSGEEFPSLADDQQKTIDTAFGGDAAAYQAAWPAAIMAAHAPYTGTFAVFGAGTADTRYGPGDEKLFTDALGAGMDATYLQSQGNAHNAAAWSDLYRQGLDLIAAHWGLDR